MDITQLILDDHAEQRRLFALIDQIDDADTASLAAVWGRLSAFLDVHAEAEERLFYPQLLKVGQGAADAAHAFVENMIGRRSMLRTCRGSSTDPTPARALSRSARAHRC